MNNELTALSKDPKYPMLAALLKVATKKPKKPTKVKKPTKRKRVSLKEESESEYSDASIHTSDGSDFDDSEGDGYGACDDTIRISDVVKESFPEHYDKIKGRDYIAIGKIMKRKYMEKYGYEVEPMKHRVNLHGLTVLVNSYDEDDMDLMEESISEFLQT